MHQKRDRGSLSVRSARKGEGKGVQTYSLRKRKSKVRVEDFARPPRPVKPPGFNSFFSSLPNILLAEDFKELVLRMRQAKRRESPIIWGLGAHVIKTGITPVIIDLARRGWVQGIALNGAGLIHDFEIACAGHTSEEVEEALEKGEFGFTEETGRELNQAVSQGVRLGMGIGEAVGKYLMKSSKFKVQSVKGKVRFANPKSPAPNPKAGQGGFHFGILVSWPLRRSWIFPLPSTWPSGLTWSTFIRVAMGELGAKVVLGILIVLPIW